MPTSKRGGHDNEEGIPRKGKVMSKVTRDMTIALVKRGDTIQIKPIDSMPNLDRVIKVQYVEKDGFWYGMTSSCDGYLLPFWAIKSIKIIG